MKVDIVVPWVNGSDDIWRDKYNYYLKKESDGEKFVGSEGFRSSIELLDIWLLGIKKYAHWVNNIFILVDRNNWRQTDKEYDENVVFVYHDEFIPNDMLPTFNSNVIECFVGNIPEISEHFILFNDDCYIVNDTSVDDFFSKSGLPVDSDAIYPVMTTDSYGHILLNNIIHINNRYDFKKYRNGYFKRHWKRAYSPRVMRSLLINELFSNFIGWQDEHLPVAYRKTDFENTFKKYKEAREGILKHKFRSIEDVSHLLARYYRLVENKYEFRPINSLGTFIEIEPSDEQLVLKDLLEKAKYKIICVNDRKMSEDVAITAYKALESLLGAYFTR